MSTTTSQTPRLARAIAHERSNFEAATIIVSDPERHGGKDSGLHKWAEQYLRRRRGSPAASTSKAGA